jgi:hypothetical protein
VSVLVIIGGTGGGGVSPPDTAGVVVVTLVDTGVDGVHVDARAGAVGVLEGGVEGEGALGDAVKTPGGGVALDSEDGHELILLDELHNILSVADEGQDLLGTADGVSLEVTELVLVEDGVGGVILPHEDTDVGHVLLNVDSLLEEHDVLGGDGPLSAVQGNHGVGGGGEETENSGGNELHCW